LLLLLFVFVACLLLVLMGILFCWLFVVILRFLLLVCCYFWLVFVFVDFLLLILKGFVACLLLFLMVCDGFCCLFVLFLMVFVVVSLLLFFFACLLLFWWVFCFVCFFVCLSCRLFVVIFVGFYCLFVVIFDVFPVIVSSLVDCCNLLCCLVFRFFVTSGFRFVFYGDLGIKYAQPTIDRVTKLVEDQQIDAVFHVGDIAYVMSFLFAGFFLPICLMSIVLKLGRAFVGEVDIVVIPVMMFNNDLFLLLFWVLISYANNRVKQSNGTWYEGVLDYFYNTVQPISQKVPYMTCPGFVCFCN